MNLKSVVLATAAVSVVGAGAAYLLWPVHGTTGTVALVQSPPDPSGADRTDQLAEPWRAEVQQLGKLLAGVPSENRLSADERLRRLRGLFAMLKDVERLISKNPVTVDAVAAEAGTTPTAIHAWVRSHTSVVPYRGVLRGAAGVSVDRVGNSLDRSILLAALLRASNVPTRLARAELTSEQAAAEWQRLAAAQAPGTAQGDSPEADFAPLDAYTRQSGVPTTQLRSGIAHASVLARQVTEEVTRRVGIQTAKIARQLEHQPSTLSDAERSSEIEALRDHWWVQWREKSAWTDLDPDEPKPGDAMAAPIATFEPDQIPADLFHDIQIRLVVEQWNGTVLKESSPLVRRIRTSDVNGDTIVLRHVPMTWPKELGLSSAPDATHLRDAVLHEREWMPVLDVGGQRLHQASFTDTGDLNDRPGSKPTALGKAGGSIADAFGGGDEPAPGVLTAEWIEYEIRTPGEPTQTIRREIFDLVGPAARSKGEGPSALSDEHRLRRGLSLLGETEILALGFQPSPDLYQRRTLAAWIADQAKIERLVAGSAAAANNLIDQAAQLRPLWNALGEFAIARCAWRRSTGVYLRQANVLSRHRFPTAVADGSFKLTAAFDIVFNDVGVLPAGPPDRFLVRLEQGVLDATAEAALAGASAAGGTAADLYGLDQTKDRWVHVRTPEQLDQTNLPPDIRARVSTDIRAGFAVLTPSDTEVSASGAGWWRINPQTGHLMSIGDRGWGQATVEYALPTTTVTFNACLFMTRNSTNRPMDDLARCALLSTAVGGVVAGHAVVMVVSTLGFLAFVFLLS